MPPIMGTRRTGVRASPSSLLKSFRPRLQSLHSTTSRKSVAGKDVVGGSGQRQPSSRGYVSLIQCRGRRRDCAPKNTSPPLTTRSIYTRRVCCSLQKLPPSPQEDGGHAYRRSYAKLLRGQVSWSQSGVAPLLHCTCRRVLEEPCQEGR